MNDDELKTPVCQVCGEHIGIHTDAVLILRGQFFMNKVDDYAMFVLDPDTKYAALELENGLGPGEHQQALVIDPANPDPILPLHAECFSEEMQLEDDDDEEEDDDEDEAAVLDRQMQEAIERDFDEEVEGVEPEWDDNDMLHVERPQ